MVQIRGYLVHTDRKVSLMDIVAEDRLLAVYPDGISIPVALRVARPTPHADGDWVCEVEGAGLRLWQGPTQLVGAGSWHALMMGLRFLREMLSSEIRQGAVFHRGDGEHAISVEKLFILHEIT